LGALGSVRSFSLEARQYLSHGYFGAVHRALRRRGLTGWWRFRRLVRSGIIIEAGHFLSYGYFCCNGPPDGARLGGLVRAAECLIIGCE